MIFLREKCKQVYATVDDWGLIENLVRNVAESNSIYPPPLMKKHSQLTYQNVTYDVFWDGLLAAEREVLKRDYPVILLP